MGKIISIVVPIYKVEKELDRCVQSIMHQTYRNIEIILVDDGSPDKCPAMCDEYAKKDERIVVIHKKNGGLSDARNAGLRIAKGDYVMYVDSDDYIESDACEKLIEHITDDIDLVVGACKEINGSSIKFQRHTNLEEGKVYEAQEYVTRSIKKGEWYAPAWLNLYRRLFLMEHDLFYKEGYIFEDMEMLPRLFLANPKVTYVDYPFYYYIIRENSIMTSANTKKKIDLLISIYSEWYKLMSTVSDQEYRDTLYGVLAKHYLASAREQDIRGWRVEGVNFPFAWKYALNGKERMKALLFHVAPSLFSTIARLWMRRKND